MIEDNNIQNDQHIEKQRTSDETISIDELKQILEDHAKWISSKGRRGQKPDLSDKNPLVRIHNHHNYRDEILQSETCGCFNCCNTFSPDEIFQWWGEDKSGVEQIAICPKCGIDSVLGDSSGFPIETNFLSIMRDYFFSPNQIEV